jgi:hypothetical protein
MSPGRRSSYSAATAVRVGDPAFAKWFVPVVNEPGTTIVVSMPNLESSTA